MNYLYFWKNNECLKEPVTGENNERLVAANYLGCYCVDSEFDNKGWRYGKYTESFEWEHIPIETFPSEFRTHLLILNIN